MMKARGRFKPEGKSVTCKHNNNLSPPEGSLPLCGEQHKEDKLKVDEN